MQMHMKVIIPPRYSSYGIAMGSYDLRTIVDPSITPAPPPIATRALAVSEFTGDPAGTLYAGGFDTHSLRRTIPIGSTGGFPDDEPLGPDRQALPGVDKASRGEFAFRRISARPRSPAPAFPGAGFSNTNSAVTQSVDIAGCHDHARRRAYPVLPIASPRISPFRAPGLSFTPAFCQHSERRGRHPQRDYGDRLLNPPFALSAWTSTFGKGIGSDGPGNGQLRGSSSCIAQPWRNASVPAVTRVLPRACLPDARHCRQGPALPRAAFLKTERGAARRLWDRNVEPLDWGRKGAADTILVARDPVKKPGPWAVAHLRVVTPSWRSRLGI